MVSFFDASSQADSPPSLLLLPLGAASPLWLFFAGMTGMGVAFWWMTRMSGYAAVEAAPQSPASRPPFVPAVNDERPPQIPVAANA